VELCVGRSAGKRCSPMPTPAAMASRPSDRSFGYLGRGDRHAFP
jgi:hypothetical protein